MSYTYSSRQEKNIIELFNSTSCTYISFDIFDTLIERSLENPQDIFHYMTPSVYTMTDNYVSYFARARIEAENFARYISTREEVTLDDIYAALQKRVGLTDDEAERIKKFELECELRLIRERNIGKKLWQSALATGKKIICISDMYLSSAQIINMLESCGYNGIKHIYISSDVGLRKETTNLFRHVLNDLRCDPNEVVHIGDNIAADIDSAKRCGIKTVHIPHSIENMRQNPGYAKLLRLSQSNSASIVKGLLASRLFDKPPTKRQRESYTQGHLEHLGYAVVGPLAAAFALWLSREARLNNVSRLYFCSREGWIFKRAFEIIQEQQQRQIPSTYIYTSRRAASAALLKQPRDIIKILGIHSAALEQNTIPSTFSALAHDVFGLPFKQDDGGAESFRSYCLYHCDAILEQARVESNTYLRYLHSVGFDAETKPALVDMGGRGTIHEGIGRLLRRALPGYYMLTQSDAIRLISLGHSIHSFYGSFTAWHDGPPLMTAYRLAECLFGHTEPTAVAVRETRGGEFEPVFYDKRESPSHNKALSAIQKGAETFVRDLSSRLGPLVESVAISPEFAAEPFSLLSKSVTGDDVKLFTLLQYENIYNGERPAGIKETMEKSAVFQTRVTTRQAFKESLRQARLHPLDPGLIHGLPQFIFHAEHGGYDCSEVEYERRKAWVKLRSVLDDAEFTRVKKTKREYSPSRLAALFDQMLREKHIRYLYERASNLKGKKVFFWGCGAAYSAYKQLFKDTSPQAMLLNIAPASGRPAAVDGLPVKHPGDCLRERGIPIIIFARSCHVAAITAYIKWTFPECSNELTTCLLLPGMDECEK